MASPFIPRYSVGNYIIAPSRRLCKHLSEVRAAGIAVPGMADAACGENAPHQHLADLRRAGDFLAVGGAAVWAGDGW